MKSGGAPVTAGGLGGWTPIGAEQTATGYEVAWKVTGADQYGIWNTDSNGNYLSNNGGIVSGSSAALESLETSFHQDLNNDGVIGVPSSAPPPSVPPISGTIIESFGLTSLVQLAVNYYLDSNSSGSGPELKYGGAAVTTGEFGGWTAIGTEQTATGYEVAWKMTGADQYGVWNTDSNGNYLSNNGGIVSGASTALENLETLFHQDLNGDGVIGVPASAPPAPLISGTIIESFGSTALVEVGNNFYLDSNVTGTGPALKYGGTLVTAGEFGGWTAIGTEQTATGYEVAWKMTGADQYGVWATDSNGNYLSNIGGLVSGTSNALQALETSFHQDLNGDGVIGAPSPAPPTISGTIIESFGSTSLVQVGSNLFLDSNTTGAGPELKYNGTLVTSGEFGGWTAIGTEQTATGYEVAWKMTGADQYGVWATDSNGNYLSNIGAIVSGASPALETLENSFHQDLNGDGVVGIPSLATSPVVNNQSAAIPANGSGSVNFAASGGGSFVFDPNFGHVTITNDTIPAGLDFSHAVFANVSALLAAAKDDGHGNVVISDATHDTLTIQKMTAQQLHTLQSDFHIV